MPYTDDEPPPEPLDLDFVQNWWIAWTYIADPGTHADEARTLRRAAALLVAILGVVNWVKDQSYKSISLATWCVSSSYFIYNQPGSLHYGGRGVGRMAFRSSAIIANYYHHDRC